VVVAGRPIFRLLESASGLRRGGGLDGGVLLGKEKPALRRVLSTSLDPGLRRDDATAKAFARSANAPLRHLILPSL
jgi:hypothetical protein